MLAVMPIVVEVVMGDSGVRPSATDVFVLFRWCESANGGRPGGRSRA